MGLPLSLAYALYYALAKGAAFGEISRGQAFFMMCRGIFENRFAKLKRNKDE
jgi:hypothetical protein